MFTPFISAIAALLLANAVTPEQGAEPASDDLAVVLVTGEQPGPALWKVSSGDHVLWILGEVAPQPRQVTWRSKRFEALLDKSQEVLLDFSGVLWPNKLQEEAEGRIRPLPSGQTLKDVVPPGLYCACRGRPETLRHARTHRRVASLLRGQAHPHERAAQIGHGETV